MGGRGEWKKEKEEEPWLVKKKPVCSSNDNLIIFLETLLIYCLNKRHTGQEERISLELWTRFYVLEILVTNTSFLISCILCFECFLQFRWSQPDSLMTLGP